MKAIIIFEDNERKIENPRACMSNSNFQKFTGLSVYLRVVQEVWAARSYIGWAVGLCLTSENAFGLTDLCYTCCVLIGFTFPQACGVIPAGQVTIWRKRF